MTNFWHLISTKLYYYTDTNKYTIYTDFYKFWKHESKKNLSIFKVGYAANP